MQVHPSVLPVFTVHSKVTVKYYIGLLFGTPSHIISLPRIKKRCYEPLLASSLNRHVVQGGAKRMHVFEMGSSRESFFICAYLKSKVQVRKPRTVDNLKVSIRDESQTYYTLRKIKYKLNMTTVRSVSIIVITFVINVITTFFPRVTHTLLDLSVQQNWLCSTHYAGFSVLFPQL